MKKLKLVSLFFVCFNWVCAQHFLKDSLEAQYNYKIADSLYKLSRYKEAIDYITPVAAFYIEANLWDKAIKSNILLIKNQLLLGQYNEAKKLCLNSLELNKQYLNDSIAHDVLLNSAGIIHMRLGDNYKSLDYLLQALTIKQHLYNEYDASIALAHNAISIIYKNIGFYDKALTHINKAIEIYKKSARNDELELARYYNNIGDIYVEIGDYNLATDYLTQSLYIYQQHFNTNKFTTSIVHLSLGIAYLKQKKFSIALEHTNKAYKIASAFLDNSHPFLIYVQHNSALILLKQGNKKEARNLFLGNLKIISKKLGNEIPEITKYNAGIASSYMPDSLGLAIAYYKKAINLQEKLLGDKNPLLAAYYSELGGAYFKNSNHLEALRAIDKSIYSNIFIDGDKEYILDKKALLNSLRLKGQVLVSRDYKHDMDTALSLYIKCDSLITTTRKQYQTYEDKIKLGETAQGIYQEGIELSYMLNKKNGANTKVKSGFYFSEKNKAIALLNAYPKRNINLFSNIPDSILSLEKETQIKISNLEIELYNETLGKKTKGKLNKIQEDIISLRHTYNNINSTIAQTYPNYYQLKHNTKTATIEEIQTRILGKDKVLVEYFFGDSSIYIFTITKGNYDMKKVSIDSIFHSHFNQFRNSLSSP
ncbi:MAG: tetratricopeptide repeat protein, partial [Flavobacteriaceae bacterium]|nr:tetratricopeptide repeat protein [Flavobacteriaceae bacterium]